MPLRFFRPSSSGHIRRDTILLSGVILYTYRARAAVQSVSTVTLFHPVSQRILNAFLMPIFLFFLDSVTEMLSC